MLATPGTALPTGAQWTHEIKWDGIRALADVAQGRLRLSARSENEITVAWPELAGLVRIASDVLLDGEIVVMDGGVPSFSALAERMHVRAPRRAAELAEAKPATYLIFDLLRLDGMDVTGLSLADRRGLLERLDLAGPAWHLSPRYDDGPLLRDLTAAQGLEGTIAKRLDSVYRPGVRSDAWLKFPHRHTDSYVVGGWRGEVDSPGTLGALLVGVPDGAGGLRYAGRVGSGLAGRAGRELLPTLCPLEGGECPFSTEVPRLDRAGTHWLRPEFVIDARSLGTPEAVRAGQRLRHPVFVRARPDLTVAELVRAQEGEHA